MRWLAVILTATLLGGCASRDMSDLQAYVEEVKARPPSGISPPPEPVEVETYLYVAGDRRDPFTPDTAAEEQVQTVVSSGIMPDVNRRKEELEFFPLDSLRMVGTLEQSGQLWALVKTKEGTIHRVTVGNHMGRNYGKIVEISEDKIKLVELVQIGSGYQEQEAEISLGEGG
jgi:type IV pilus assembly protein PilP